MLRVKEVIIYVYMHDVRFLGHWLLCQRHHLHPNRERERDHQEKVGEDGEHAIRPLKINVLPLKFLENLGGTEKNIS